jgi:hypothetical protein
MTTPMPDLYGVLGVPRDAGDQEVRDAYRRLAKRYHPDLHPDASTSERMRRVNEAWDVLSDRARKARYDASMRARPWPPAWASAATAAGPGERGTGWATSTWAAPAGGDVGPTLERTRASGPPWLGVAAILIVGWLAIGGLAGGFPLPLVAGLLVVAAVSAALDRLDR